jgi:hypothetical protein
MLWAPACDNGRRIGHHCRRRVSSIKEHTDADRKRLITTLIYQLQLNCLKAALEKVCARPPAPQAASAWIRQIDTAGGASGSATIVMVYGRSFVLFCVVSQLVTPQSGLPCVKNVPQHNLISLTAIGPYLAHRFFGALFKVNNFLDFCPLTTFDSSKCS